MGTNLRAAAIQVLEALVRVNASPHLQDLHHAFDEEITALHQALAEPEQEPVDSPEKAGAYMDARLWEFIDMAAAWPETRPDSRTWGHVMVYAPTPRKPLTDEEIDALMPPLPVTNVIVDGLWEEQHGPYTADQMRDYALAARALYTAPAPRKPLSEQELDAMRQADGGALNFVTLRAFRVVARAVEAAHGITGETK